MRQERPTTATVRSGQGSRRQAEHLSVKVLGMRSGKEGEAERSLVSLSPNPAVEQWALIRLERSRGDPRAPGPASRRSNRPCLRPFPRRRVTAPVAHGEPDGVPHRMPRDVMLLSSTSARAPRLAPHIKRLTQFVHAACLLIGTPTFTERARGLYWSAQAKAAPSFYESIGGLSAELGWRRRAAGVHRPARRG